MLAEACHDHMLELGESRSFNTCEGLNKILLDCLCLVTQPRRVSSFKWALSMALHRPVDALTSAAVQSFFFAISVK